MSSFVISGKRKTCDISVLFASRKYSDLVPKKQKLDSPETPNGQYETYSFETGRMCVYRDCAPPGVDLYQLQNDLVTLPKKFYSKNKKRNSSHKIGQAQGGFTCAAGQQTPLVYGLNAPYRNKNELELLEHHPSIHKRIGKVLSHMWSVVREARPSESENMEQTSSELRLFDTGFTKYSIATNFQTEWHRDETNQKDGVQAVFVFGKFTGGDLCINSSACSSNYVLGDVTKITCSGGTLFIGDYKSLWHTVSPILTGTRTIIAAYCREDVAKFDRVARRRGGISRALALRDQRIAARRAIERIRNGLRNQWKSIDAQVMTDVEHEHTCRTQIATFYKQLSAFATF